MTLSQRLVGHTSVHPRPQCANGLAIKTALPLISPRTYEPGQNALYHTISLDLSRPRSQLPQLDNAQRTRHLLSINNPTASSSVDATDILKLYLRLETVTLPHTACCTPLGFIVTPLPASIREITVNRGEDYTSWAQLARESHVLDRFSLVSISNFEPRAQSHIRTRHLVLIYCFNDGEAPVQKWWNWNLYALRRFSSHLTSLTLKYTPLPASVLDAVLSKLGSSLVHLRIMVARPALTDRRRGGTFIDAFNGSQFRHCKSLRTLSLEYTSPSPGNTDDITLYIKPFWPCAASTCYRI